MQSLVYPIHYFLLSLGIGTYLFSPLVSTEYTGAGLVKLLMSVTLSCLVLAGCLDFIFMDMDSLSMLLYGKSLACLIIFYLYLKDKKTRSLKILTWLISLQLLALGYFSFEDFSIRLIFFLTVLFAGIVNYMMLLGHYYLVVPKLSEKPLLISTYILWFFLACKLGLSCYTYLQHTDYYEAGTYLGEGYMYNWLWLVMRVLWGYVAIFILSIFGYKLSKMRSIQSATGIFYVMVFFMIIGELVSAYLVFQNGLLI